MDARLGFGTRLRWFCDRFVTVGFGENEHFAVALIKALAAMWINLIGMSDVNSDSSDTDSASVAMSPTATLL